MTDASPDTATVELTEAFAVLVQRLAPDIEPATVYRPDEHS